MQIKDLHNWKLSPAQARDLQKSLAGKVQFLPLRHKLKLVGGLDCAFSKDGKNIITAAVVLKVPGFEVVETRYATRKVESPYIPGLLSFREAPVCIAAVKKLKYTPDVFIIDGQGIAHPRRLGLAAHLGLFFDRPTIGCAKSRLTGTFEELGAEKGSYSELKDKGEIIGAAVRTRTNIKPVFVSVGNKCTLRDAINIILRCATRYRLPEPTRLAHQLVSKKKCDYP